MGPLRNGRIMGKHELVKQDKKQQERSQKTQNNLNVSFEQWKYILQKLIKNEETTSSTETQQTLSENFLSQFNISGNEDASLSLAAHIIDKQWWNKLDNGLWKEIANFPGGLTNSAMKKFDLDCNFF